MLCPVCVLSVLCIYYIREFVKNIIKAKSYFKQNAKIQNTLWKYLKYKYKILDKYLKYVLEILVFKILDNTGHEWDSCSCGSEDRIRAGNYATWK